MFGRRSQRDFEDEIRAHLELEAERLRAQGMAPADAERAARREMWRKKMESMSPEEREAWRKKRREGGGPPQ